MNNYRILQSILIPVLKTKFHIHNHIQWNNCKVGNRQSFCLVHTNHQLQTEIKTTDEQSILVYEGPLKKRIKLVKILSLSSSMIGFALLPIVILDLSKISIALAVVGGVVSTAFLSTPLLLNWITKRYVLQLHYDYETKQFKAKRFNLYTQEVEVQFSASDVTVPDVPGMLSSFLVRGEPLFVDFSIVKDADVYAHMMGYDKPFNFKLQGEEERKDVKAS